MAIPAGYTQSPSGFFFYTDGSGPYAIAQDGTPYLIAGAGGGGGGGGDASAANQSTQITAANLTNTKLDTANTNLGTINTSVATVDTSVGTVNTSVGTVNTSIGTMSAKLPSSVGAKTAANSLSVTPASDATFALTSSAYRAQTSVTRPANTTAYSAGDVVGGAITLASIGPTAGHIMLTSVDLRYDVAAIPSGMTSFRLYLYNVTPPSAIADNAAFDLPSGDRASFIGYIDLGNPLDLGATLFAQMDGVNKQVKLAAAETSLYAYLVTTGAYTPAANSEVFAITLRSIGV